MREAFSPLPGPSLSTGPLSRVAGMLALHRCSRHSPTRSRGGSEPWAQILALLLMAGDMGVSKLKWVTCPRGQQWGDQRGRS